MAHSRAPRPLPEGSYLAFDPPGGRVKPLRTRTQLPEGG